MNEYVCIVCGADPSGGRVAPDLDEHLCRHCWWRALVWAARNSRPDVPPFDVFYTGPCNVDGCYIVQPHGHRTST
jgi:hypothetical protein